MSVEENKAIMRRFYTEVLTGGNLDLIDEFIAEDLVDHTPMDPGLPPGPEGVKQGFVMLRRAFPDLEITVEEMIGEGDTVVSRLTMRGTHRGEFMGIAPTGKRVEVAVMDVVRFAGGKAVEHRDLMDTLSLMQQLGVISPPGQAGP